jgi:hypothetical protein
MHPVARVSTNTLIKTTVRNNKIEHGKHLLRTVVFRARFYCAKLNIVHNKIEHEKHLLRTVVLIKVLEETHNCQTEKKSPVMSSRWGPDMKTDWPTDRNLTATSVWVIK